MFQTSSATAVRGNRLVLDNYEKAFGGDAADLPRFAKLGVIASMQPSHAMLEAKPVMTIVGGVVYRPPVSK